MLSPLINLIRHLRIVTSRFQQRCVCAQTFQHVSHNERLHLFPFCPRTFLGEPALEIKESFLLRVFIPLYLNLPRNHLWIAQETFCIKHRKNPTIVRILLPWHSRLPDCKKLVVSFIFSKNVPVFFRHLVHKVFGLNVRFYHVRSDPDIGIQRTKEY